MSKIRETALHALAPTQITVGMIEVADKKKQLAALKGPDQADFLRDHPIPAVIGPQGRLYITDHHHLGRALSEIGRALKDDPRSLRVMYQAAIVYEIAGDRDRALGFIGSAVKNGFPVEDIRKEQELAQLRADPRFARLITQ